MSLFHYSKLLQNLKVATYRSTEHHVMPSLHIPKTHFVKNINQGTDPISGSRHEVNKNYVRLGYYTKISDNSLQTFRDNSSARPEIATDKISPDVSKELPLLAA